MMMKSECSLFKTWEISLTSAVLNIIWVDFSLGCKRFLWWNSEKHSYFSPALLALLAAGLGCSIRQTAAGRWRLSVFVPVFVPKPGEGYAGRDGRHWSSWREVPTRLLQQLCWPPNDGRNTKKNMQSIHFLITTRFFTFIHEDIHKRAPRYSKESHNYADVWSTCYPKMLSWPPCRIFFLYHLISGGPCWWAVPYCC